MIPIAKAHAYGNDFLYVRAAALEVAHIDPVAFAVRVCARTTGIGADGLIVFKESPVGAQMRLINPDGSHAEVSGNGVRALGALLARVRAWGDPPFEGRALTIDTDAGPKVLTLLGAAGTSRFLFRAAMGKASDVEEVALDVGDECVKAVRLDMGNPQCVVFDVLDHERLIRLGLGLQRHPAFPQAVNFELAQVEGRDRVRILIFERGVGPTQSSGTGSCAAAVAAMSRGLVDREVEVIAPGGSQRVEWTEDGVLLTGWAEVLSEGHWVADADAAASLRSR